MADWFLSAPYRLEGFSKILPTDAVKDEVYSEICVIQLLAVVLNCYEQCEIDNFKDSNLKNEIKDASHQLKRKLIMGTV